jgi:hypothetical protein
MLSRSLILVILMLMTACGTGIKPEQIARVEQNFDKIKPGMTKDEVEKLVGKPYRDGTITYNIADSPNNKMNEQVLECKIAPCSWDVWALAAEAGEDDLEWPIIAFDRNTHRVIKIFRDELEDYFPL